MYKKVEKCPACYGTGIQRSPKTGLKVLCYVCGGTGKKPSVKPRWSITGRHVVWKGYEVKSD